VTSIVSFFIYYLVKDNTLEVSGFPSTVWLPTFFKISSFVQNRTKKLIQFYRRGELQRTLTEKIKVDVLSEQSTLKEEKNLS